MTQAATSSPQHVSNMERWLKIARNRNPRLSEEQMLRLAQHLRAEHYRKAQRASAAARAANRKVGEGRDGEG